MTGFGIYLPTASASTQTSDLDRQIEERRATITQARAQCSELLQATPDADRLHVMMNDCFPDRDIFRPIAGTLPPAPSSGPRTPIFHPDPNR